MKKILRLRVITLLICLVMYSLVGCGNQKVSLQEYVVVTVDGYDGYGNANIEIDRDGINSLVKDEDVKKYISGLSIDEWIKEWLMQCSFADLIEMDFQNQENNISNGDVLVVEVSVSEELEMYGETIETLQEGLGISISDTEIEIAIDGLEEAKVLDVMSFVEEYIVYEGANGGASAAVEFPYGFTYEMDGFAFAQRNYTNGLDIIYNNSLIKSISYFCEYDEKLSGGDELKLVIYEEDITLGDTGYIINNQKTVTVPDLGEYVSSKEDITPELKEALIEAFAQKVADTEIVVQKSFWGTIKPSAVSDNIEEDRNAIYVAITYDAGYFWGTQEVLCYTTKLIKLPDGSYEIEYSYDTYFDMENITSERYDLEEIEW